MHWKLVSGSDFSFTICVPTVIDYSIIGEPANQNSEYYFGFSGKDVEGSSEIIDKAFFLRNTWN